MLQVARDLRRRGCDVVHVHNFSQFVPVIRRYNPGVKVVLHMHCEWLSQLPRELLAPRLAQTAAVVGCSDHVTALARDRFPEAPCRFETVPNGVTGRPPIHDQPTNPPPADPPPADPTVLFVGRLTPEKGVHVLLDAFARVLERHPNARLKVIGPEAETPREYLVDLPGSEDLSHLLAFYGRGYLAQLKDRLPPEAAARVEFVGSVPHDALAAHYASAAFLVNPSFSEAFGMSLVEAMTFGLPVVASAVGGMREIVVEGRTGFLVPPGDVEALAGAMDTLLARAELRTAMGRAGAARANATYTWEAVADRLVGLYRTLLDAPAPGGAPTAAGAGETAGSRR
jgi:spore coat protein SA